MVKSNHQPEQETQTKHSTQTKLQIGIEKGELEIHISVLY